MSKEILLSECPEPWLYWWRLLTSQERKGLKKKYFPSVAYIIDREKKAIWEQEKPDPISQEDWLQLATADFDHRSHFGPEERQEIWRQVYRIAGERI